MSLGKRCILLAGLIVLAGGACAWSVAWDDASAAPASPVQVALAELRAGRLVAAAELAGKIAADPARPRPQAWLIVAAARQRRGDLPGAAEAYRTFLAACEDPAAGDYALEQLAICRRGTATVPPPPALPSRALSPERRQLLAQVGSRLFVEVSDHFTVQTHNPHLSRLLVEQAESALKRITHVVMRGAEYPHSVELNVYPTARDYRRQGKFGTEWSGATFELSTDEAGFIRRVIHLTQLNDAGQFDIEILDRILPHELCHLVVTEWFGDTYCPLYLQEGLATQAEYNPSRMRIILAGAAMAAKKALPLRDLLATEAYDPDNVALYYAQTYSLMRYLSQRLSRRQFTDTLTHIKDGCTLDDALQRALVSPYDENFLAKLERAWQKDAVIQAQLLMILADSVGPRGPSRSDHGRVPGR